MRKTQNWVFTDAAERDTYDNNGGGVFNRDTCILESDASEQYYDGDSGLWLPLAGASVSAATTDATPEVLALFSLSQNFHTAQIAVMVQSVRDTGVNTRFERAYITAHRIGGVVTVASVVQETPVIAGATIAGTTAAGTGSTVAYAYGNTGNQIELTITANGGENWNHTALVQFAEAG